MKKIFLVLFAVILFSFPTVSFAAIELPNDPDEETISQISQKRNQYVKTLNSLSSIKPMMDTYLYWANKWPTTTKSVGSIGDMKNDLQRIEKLVETAAAIPTKIPGLDEAFAKVGETAKKLRSINTEAYKYYSRKDYLDDELAKGKELHPQIMKAYDDFMTACGALNTLTNELTNEVTTLQLKAIEKAYGKKYYWYHATMAEKGRILMETAAPESGERANLAAYKEAINAYAKALDEYEEYVEKVGDRAISDQATTPLMPKDFATLLSTAREVEQEISKKNVNDATYNSYINLMIERYNTFINKMNQTRFK